MVPKEEIHSEIGSDFYFGGLSDEVSGGLHPSKFVNGLATSLLSLGVVLCENTKVISIKKLGSSYEVMTPKGTIKAGRVIIATNGYTDKLVPKLNPKVFPVGSYIIVSEPLTKDLQKKLSGLNMEEMPGNKAPVLTTEQTKAFQKFRSEMLDVRRQLREVQHNLRKDIEELDTVLKILNIWTVPVVVAVIAIVMAFIRRRRYSRPQIQG